MKKLVAILMVAVFIAPILGALVSNAGYVQTIITKRIEEDTNAIGSLLTGDTQARLFPVNDYEAANKLANAGFKLITPASGMDDLLVNPTSNCSNGQLNIFSNRKVRFALQFLVPRDQIVANIAKGYGIPQYIPYTPYDPDYPYLLATAIKIQSLVKNKGEKYGEQLLAEGLQELGATKGSDGKWYYKGKQVTVKFVIRVEDIRKDIGDQIANKLEQLGLKVERLYKDFSGAIKLVYYGDASACEWQLYTEGWGISGMTKYDYGTAVAFWTTYYGWTPDPTWGSDYQNKTLYELGKKLDTGNYTSMDEFWKLYNEVLWLGFHEAVRVFILATEDIYIASPDLGGIVQSPKASPWNPFTYASLQYSKGDTVKFSDRYVYKEGWAWNPVGGFQDAYSVAAVANAIYFPMGITSRITDGETGWSPSGATFKIVKNATIPDNALLYSPSEHKFVTAKEAGLAGKKVLNEVIINYPILPKIKFHDGTQMTMADLFSNIYMAFEWGVDASTNTTKDPWFEKYVARDYTTMIATFKAVKIINNTAIAVYTNYTSIDPGLIAQTADLMPSAPLEVYVGMDLLAKTGKYVIDIRDQSPEQNIIAIHLVDPTQVNKTISLLKQAINNPPSWVQDLINLGLLTKDEWAQRVNNLINFANEYHNLLVGNGPYYLASYDSVNDQVTLKRWQYFPIDPQKLYEQLQPKTASIKTTVLPVTPNKKGSVIATATVKVNGQPATMDDIIPFALLVNLKTFDSVFANITMVKPGLFKIILPKDLPEGYYQLSIMIYPKGYSNPALDNQVIHLIAPPPTTSSPTPSPTTSTTATQTTTTTTTTTTTAPTTTTSTQSPTTTAKAKGGVSAATWAAVIIIIIILAAAYYYLRK
ncbi:MAG: ABC transporter substrate-binding protein [Desulfurococcales archaeon]|nr:ABC transporter substrate-binding protein [Desulfurococcales archaeon]